jgi:hypothetical protein
MPRAEKRQRFSLTCGTTRDRMKYEDVEQGKEVKAMADEAQTPEVESEPTMVPKDLAKELEIDPKSLRNWLRKEYTRELAVKGTDWEITQEMADAARARWAKKSDESEADETETESTDEA